MQTMLRIIRTWKCEIITGKQGEARNGINYIGVSGWSVIDRMGSGWATVIRGSINNRDEEGERIDDDRHHCDHRMEDDSFRS